MICLDVKPFAISSDGYSIAIVCPFCHEIHWHGFANGDYKGPRVPHCRKPRQNGMNYFIVKVNQALPVLNRHN